MILPCAHDARALTRLNPRSPAVAPVRFDNFNVRPVHNIGTFSQLEIFRDLTRWHFSASS